MFLCSKVTIGIGGNIGSGKSTVAKIFAQYGAKVISADQIGWSVYKKNSPWYHKLVKNFGTGILKQNGTINRKRLGKIVFRNKKKLHKLNRIIHPEIIKRIFNKIRESEYPIIVVDAALLFNWQLYKSLNYTILVTAPKPLKISRMRRLGLTRSEILSRLANQLKESEMKRYADFVVKNNRGIKELRERVKLIIKKIAKNQERNLECNVS